MASSMQSLPRILKMLRENSNIREKREALTYIRSNSKKLESTEKVKEEQYKELCKLVVEAFANGNNDIQNEAYETLNVIIQDLKGHTLNLFEAMSQINPKIRLKILKLLDVIEDNAISTIAYDTQAVNFFTNCMSMIQTNQMPWIAPAACIEDLQALIDAENKSLSDDQRLEEETVNYCLNLLRRLYKLAGLTSDTNIEKFDALLFDKVMLLAYMGHKRQRGAALKLLQKALTTNILSHIRTKLPNVWIRYKSALQTTYCKRMLLLVSACEMDWATQWNISIQFLGVDLHKGASLINNLLSIEEKAFKSTDTVTRRQAFLSWKLLVDNFALDPLELASARRIKLLCIPLNAKNSKTELIALTKLEVWWHVIIKLYKDIYKFVNPVLTQFLNFCFGPLGDTPLLSSKFDVIASPGKRFYKTKIVAVDALCQLLVTKQENHVFVPILEERLPHSMTDAVFRECYKSIIHSVGEALLVLSQLTDAEMQKRYQLGRILWKNLISYVQESKMENKENMYKDIVLVTTELASYVESKSMIRQLILDTILFEIAELSKQFNFQEDIVSVLLFKLLQPVILNEAEKNHYNALKSLLWQCVKSSKENTYYPHAFKVLKAMHLQLNTLLNVQPRNESIILRLWLILTEILIIYMDDIQEINEGSATEHNFETVESIVMFPFMHIHLKDEAQVQELIKTWKRLCKHFEMRADLIETVKTNEVLLNIATSMQSCLIKIEKSCHLIISCLDVLLSSFDYKLLIATTKTPSIICLIVDLITFCFFKNFDKGCDSALKALSAVLITIYGHNPKKLASYLQVCKPAFELMLTSECATLNKEITNTWESVMSIMKGLGIFVDHQFLSSFRKVLVQALNHTNFDIREQAESIFQIKEVLSNDAKLLLEEIEREASINKFPIKSEIPNKMDDHTGELPNQIGEADCTRGFAVKSTLTETDVGDKKPLLHADSQDYVFVKSNIKYDVNRLTEHQKESLKRKRDDIPALYSDLSQSSSQDTQNLQEWFNKKNTMLEKIENAHNKNDSSLVECIVDDDANKENKIKLQSEILNKSAVVNDKTSTENIIHNISTETTQQVNDNADSDGISPVKNEKIVTEVIPENSDIKASKGCVTKDLSCNILEEPSASKDNDQRLSPSILDSGTRRNRLNNSLKTYDLSKLDDMFDSQSEQPNATQALQKRLKTKVTQQKSDSVNKQNVLNDAEIESLKNDKRGIKRKSASDTESERVSQCQRRKTGSLETTSCSESYKSIESDDMIRDGEETAEGESLSQRTKNEISRLRINMVFDCPLTNRRRSKGNKDNSETKLLESRGRGGGRGRSRRGKIRGTQNISHDQKDDEVEESREAEEEENKEKDVAVNSTLCPDLSVTKESTSIEAEIFHENVEENKDVDQTVNDESDKFIDDNFQTQDDMEDIIENSQKESELEKIMKQKQCDVNINNENLLCTAEDEEVAQIVLNKDTMISKPNVEAYEKTIEDNASVPKASTPVIDKNSFDNEKNGTTVTLKLNEGSSFKSIVDFPSPKSNTKPQLKFKSYAVQGRAAHMLGLVTKQAQLEGGCQVITVDDDTAVKKTKSKDTETEVLGKKERGSIFKEVDKVLTICSSRQEKIFNNMKSSDYCPSPPIKLFSNLKNDGEKIFSKTDKSLEYISIQTDAQAEKVGEDAPPEIDELPILEWSSANPPSLTASPSVSILKRQRQSLLEPDLDSSALNKRKRVSFADPPVSKEMGYEISSSDFAHKTNKIASKGMLGRKDSPLRLKQAKQKLINTDSVKSGKDEEEIDINITEIDLQCEKENELLTKMAEELEYSENTDAQINTDAQTRYNVIENDSTNTITVETSGCNKVNFDNLNAEFEITEDSAFPKLVESTSINTLEQNKVSQASKVLRNSNSNVDLSEFNESTTQEDIFNGTDPKYDDKDTYTDSTLSDVQNISIQSNSLDSLKFNTSKESIINHYSEVHVNTENLEDTVDAGNLTRLNSSANTDEIFCGNLIRTSTQTTENIEEQDTLPVTDSVFGSLPLSQDSQNTGEFHINIPQPELYDSICPIYPDLISCQEPITSIIRQLTNSLWVRHLTAYFASRNLQTVGDLARLSEREINRIPLKGNSKVKFVKTVLKSFKKMYVQEGISKTSENVKDVSNSKVSASANIRTPISVKNVVTYRRILPKPPETTQNKLSNSFSQSRSSKVSDSTVMIDTNTFQKSKKFSDFILNESLNTSAIDVSSMSSQVSYESITEGTTSSSISISHPSTSIVPSTQMISIPMSSMILSASLPETVGSSNFSAKSGILSGYSGKIVGTGSNSNNSNISLTKTEGNKTTRSVASQMALEDLLDEIDVNLVLESAVRRCPAEKIISQYKNKMKHMSQIDLEKETIKMLGVENLKNCSEVTLKTACRACGVNKVLLRLPDIFSSDKQFFAKVLTAYKKKIQVNDCMDVLDFSEVKDAVCKKCSSSELAEMLSKKLKEEEQEGIREPMTELSSLNAMLKRMPMDLIISHTVANEELIPSRVVLDIALQNNSPSDIASALQNQSSLLTNDVFQQLWSSQLAVNHIEQLKSKQDLLTLFKTICSKLSQQELLQAFYESMNAKVVVKQEKF